MKKILALTIFILLALAGAGWAAYTDNFTGANGTDLTTYDSNWTTSTYGFTIQSNTAQANVDNQNHYAIYSGGTFAGAQYSQATVAAGNYPGVIVNVADDFTTGYKIIYLSSTSIRVTKIGTGDMGADITTSAMTLGTSKIKLASDGGAPTTTLTISVDYAGNGTWAVVGTRTDGSSPFTTGKPGIYGWNNSDALDNWEGGDVSAVVAPTVTCQDATSLTNTTATLNGNVTVNNGTISAYGFYISKTNNPPTASDTVVNGAGLSGATGAYTGSATSLTAGSTYHCVAFATNEAGTGTSANHDFTTKNAPAIHTDTSQCIGGTCAMVFGHIIGTSANDAITEMGFCYGTSDNPTTAGTHITVNNRPNSKYWGWNTNCYFSGDLTSLSTNQKYYFRPYIVSGGVTYYGEGGETNTFTTRASAYSGVTYYVDADNVGGTASDAYNTTQAQVITTPWATLAKAIPELLPGDTLYLRGKTGGSRYWLGNKRIGYPGVMEIGLVLGCQEAPITISGYGTEVVTLTGLKEISGATWTNTSGNIWKTTVSAADSVNNGINGFSQLSEDSRLLSGVVNITAAGQWTQDNFNAGTGSWDIYIWCSDNANPNTHSIGLMYWSSNVAWETGTGAGAWITFQNLRVEGGNSGSGYGYPVTVSCNHITFTNVKFSNYSGAVKVFGEGQGGASFNSENGLFDSCEFTGFANQGLDITGGDWYRVTNCKFHDNVSTTGNPIMLKDNACGLIFDKNLIYNIAGYTSSNVGCIIYIGGQSFTGKADECVGLRLYNNIIVNNTNFDNVFTFMGADDCRVYNNTIANNTLNYAVAQTTTSKGGETGNYIGYDNILKNNIIWNNTVGGSSLAVALTDPVTYRWAAINNLWDTSKGSRYYVTGTYDLTSLPFASPYNGFEVNSVVNSDPKFAVGTGNVATNYKIKTASPAIGAGVDMGLTTDFAGTTYTTNFPIGAWDLTASSAPTVTTQAVSDVSYTTATGNGTITGDGDGTISENGVAIGASANPTIAGAHFNPSPADVSGAFVAALTGLTPNTLYHARAFATNEAGTGYGADVEFTTEQSLGGGGVSLGLGLSGGNYRPRP